MKTLTLLVTNLLMLMFISNNAIAESAASISLGYEQTTGNYGLTEETKITTIPVSLQYIKDDWAFNVSVPFISITGTGDVIPTSGGMGGFGNKTGSAVTTQRGLGDVSASIAYSIQPKNSSMYYEITGAVKLGTASAQKNLGTGENDYSLSLYSLYDKNALKPFLTVGYTLIGDTATIDFNNIMFAVAGFNYQMNSKTMLSISYDYKQAAVDGAVDGKSWSIYIARKINPKLSANLYFINGLTDSVADKGIGFGLVRNF